RGRTAAWATTGRSSHEAPERLAGRGVRQRPAMGRGSLPSAVRVGARRHRRGHRREVARVISVVVPVKNQWHLTAKLLDCLRDEPCRILVIDNGSTDCTARKI